MLRILVFMFLVICLSSCSSLRKFGEEKKFLYKTMRVDDNEMAVILETEVMYVTNNQQNCFGKPGGNVITVEAENLTKALNYFYKNKATWDIKEVKDSNGVKTEMVATNQARIQYEVAYCTFEYIGGAVKEAYDYASFRLVK